MYITEDQYMTLSAFNNVYPDVLYDDLVYYYSLEKNLDIYFKSEQDCLLFKLKYGV